MLISDLLGQYNHTSRQTKRLNDTGTRGVQKLVSALRDMGAGTIFEGTVNSMKGGKVVLGLSNGQQVSARLDGNVPLSVGQSMFFQVKSNDGTQIAIRPFTVDGNSVNLTLMNALAAAKLPATAVNLSMVNTMMQEQMPIDANSLGQMARTVSMNPEINVRTIVQMQKFDIPISQEMASQFENYMDDSQAINKAVDGFLRELPQIMSDESLSLPELRQMNDQVLTIITEGLGGEENQGSSGNVVAAAVENPWNAATTATAENIDSPASNPAARTAAAEMELTQGITQAAAEELTQGITQAASETVQTADSGPAAGIMPENFSGQEGVGRTPEAAVQAENPSAASQQSAPAAGVNGAVENSDLVLENFNIEETNNGSLLSQSGTAMPEETRIQTTAQQSLSAVEENATMTTMTSEAASPLPAEHSIGKLLSENQIQSLGEQLKTIPGLVENTNFFSEGQLLSNTNAVSILLAVRDALRGNSVLARQTVTRLFGSKAFGTLIKDALEQQWLIKPEELGKGNHKISTLYERLENQISRMEEVVKAAGKESVEFAQAAAEVRNNVEFMNQLNTAYTYAQIPLKMSGQNASGELFVYTNKKHLAQEGEKDLTAFLHLDLDHLGSTDVSIRLRGREVSTNFYLDDDDSFALVQEYLPALEARLNSKGYTCSLSVTHEKKHVNFVEDFLKKDQPSAGQQLHRYSFDMRA